MRQGCARNSVLATRRLMGPPSSSFHTVAYGSMAKVATPRERWIEGGLDALASGGPDAVRIEALAKDLGVTKGGFYWHFADRRSLLDAMLDVWEREGVDD